MQRKERKVCEIEFNYFHKDEQHTIFIDVDSKRISPMVVRIAQHTDCAVPAVVFLVLFLRSFQFPFAIPARYR